MRPAPPDRRCYVEKGAKGFTFGKPSN